MKYIIFILVFGFVISVIAKKTGPKSSGHQPQGWDDGPQVEKYWPKIEARQIGADFEIEYVNGSGESSRRRIHIQTYNGSPYLKAYCHLRNEPRTFRIDRIREAIALSSGEVINDLPGYLREIS